MSDYKYDCRLIRIIDGDTLELDVDLGFYLRTRAMVRLLGIDAPETRTRDLLEKERGLVIKEKLSARLAGVDNLVVETHKTGKFGRWLGILYDGEVNINLEVEQWCLDLDKEMF